MEVIHLPLRRKKIYCVEIIPTAKEKIFLWLPLFDEGICSMVGAFLVMPKNAKKSFLDTLYILLIFINSDNCVLVLMSGYSVLTAELFKELFFKGIHN